MAPPCAADGFVVQTGDPDGPAEGFVDPSTGKLRTIPLELMVNGDPGPIYGETLEVSGRSTGCLVAPPVDTNIHHHSRRSLVATKFKLSFLSTLLALLRWPGM